jgi:hypothetical protein
VVKASGLGISVVRLLTNIVQGVPSIRRAVINVKDKDDAKGKKGEKELLVEGYGLQKVMTTEGAWLVMA